MNAKSSQQQLLAACRKGNRRAQRQLYEQYYSWGINICMRYARNREEAKEMLNDGFLKVFTNLAKHDPQRNFQPWLKRVIINAAIDYYRRRGWQTESLDEMEEHQIPLTRTEAAQQMQYEDVLRAVQTLSPCYRMAFNLYELEGYSHAEIAQQLHISENTSRSNLKRAKEKLRLMLSAYSEGVINLTS